MERTVSSFTSEHLQQSLQHCNESISYDESTDYGGRSSATGNTHLPQHRDRCGRWVSAHLQQERTDFQVYGLPLQMCMWFWMTRQKHRIYMSWRTCKRVKGDSSTRQGALMNSSRSFHQNIKDFFKKFFIFLKKSCQVFEVLFLQNKDIKPIITHQYWLSQFKCLILATN